MGTESGTGILRLLILNLHEGSYTIRVFKRFVRIGGKPFLHEVMILVISGSSGFTIRFQSYLAG